MAAGGAVDVEDCWSGSVTVSEGGEAEGASSSMGSISDFFNSSQCCFDIALSPDISHLRITKSQKPPRVSGAKKKF